MTSLPFPGTRMSLCEDHPLASYNIKWFAKAGLLLGAHTRNAWDIQAFVYSLPET